MKATLTGRNGFIGGKLYKHLLYNGWEVCPYIRDDVDYLFLFGSASSTIQYNKNLDHCFRSTINDFIDAISYCRDHKIKLVYPSSATVQDKATPYAHCKACLEEIQQAYDTDVLGLRIFAGYGPNEAHKGDYASIVYQFCQQMKQGERPVIWGDGTQTRDFVYIDDIVETIYKNRDKKGVLDVGTGINTSFNRVVDIINYHLGTKILAEHIDRPAKYIEDTVCKNPLAVFTPIEEGIRRILNDKTV